MFLWFFGEVFVEPNWVSISGHVLFLETERFGPQIKRPEPSPIATTFCLVSVIRWSMTSPILSRCTLPRRVRNLGVIWLSPFFQPNGSSSSLNEASRGLLHSDVFFQSFYLIAYLYFQLFLKIFHEMKLKQRLYRIVRLQLDSLSVLAFLLEAQWPLRQRPTRMTSQNCKYNILFASCAPKLWRPRLITWLSVTNFPQEKIQTAFRWMR